MKKTLIPYGHEDSDGFHVDPPPAIPEAQIPLLKKRVKIILTCIASLALGILWLLLHQK